jgi:hypothetical protein
MRHTYEHQDEARDLGWSASETARRDWTWKAAALKLAGFFSIPVEPSHGERADQPVAQNVARAT